MKISIKFEKNKKINNINKFIEHKLNKKKSYL